MTEQTLLAQINADLKEAMLARDETTKLALRSLKTALTEAEKSGASRPLTEDEILQIVAKAAKQRRDSIAEFEKAGRTDLAEREAAELAVLERYLPKQLSEEEVEAIVRQVIEETGAQSAQDLGRVMPLAIQRTSGRAEGRTINRVARRLLG